MVMRTERKKAPFSPVDGITFYQSATAYESEDKKILIRRVLGGRVMDNDEIVSLIQGKTIGPFADFRSKKGKLFTASVRLNNSKVEFLFADSTEQLDIEEIKQQEPLGLSPIDQTKVYETPAAFMSESALTGDTKKGLRISKMILGRSIDPDHIAQLLNRGKTDLINGFISKKKRAL